MRQRLLLVALDGATWDLVTPLLAAGRMPALAALLREGAGGPLLSTVPPITPPAFASMFTGVEPARHGVFDFFGHARQDFRQRPAICGRDLRVTTVWRHLAAAGLRVGLVHLPMTWPPDPGLSFVVSSQPGASGIYPADLAGELASVVGERHLQPARRGWSPAWLGLPRVGEKRSAEAMAAAMAEAEALRDKAMLHLARSREWDVLAVCVKATDAIAHCCWPEGVAGARVGTAEGGGAGPAGSDVDAAATEGRGDGAPKINTDAGTAENGGLEGPLAAAYEAADRTLAALRRHAPDARVLVVSDHGHGACVATFGVNQWLLHHGWLVVRPRFRRALRSLALYRLLRAGSRGGGWEHFLRMVDWTHTRAYGGTGTEQGIYLNLAGREPGGAVHPGPEAEQLRAEIGAELLKLRLPRELEARLLEEERLAGVEVLPLDTSAGRHANRGPDIALSLWGGAVIAREGLRPGPLFAAAGPGRGTHRPVGLFALGGGKEPSKKRWGSESGRQEARVEDVAPTILELCGYEPPVEWSGRSLLTGRRERLGALRPLPPLPAGAPDLGATSAGVTRGDAGSGSAEGTERGAVKRALRDWGYLDDE
jgi:predicted AlkP superfamily phosphohydrolase/phosphomutase